MLSNSVEHCRRFAGVLLMLVMLSCSLLAQGPKPTVRPAKPETKTEAALSQPAGTHEMTADDVSAFLDGVMPLQLAREDIAGAVVAVVKDGKLLFAKGYGYSDVEKKIPVSPDATLFRPGSISKLFTWTAVLQQVEQGKLDLDRDVNDYLDYKIPATFPQPITLRNIMTHTPGFEETAQELFVMDVKRIIPLGDYLKKHLPVRIYTPGTTPAYSNYATATAGYIVQRVSGQSFDDYIDDHILKPLGMAHSTFRQPLPDNLKPLMSQGYDVASQPPKGFEYVIPEPAGSSSLTATDITHFMMAHLQDGQYQGAQILRPETVKLMHSRAFANVSDMNAMALGFYEETRNGHRIIGHGGDTEYFHSDLHLIPDANVGFFISYNSAGKGEISPREAVWQKFLDRYFPYEPPASSVPANAKQDASDISGRYIVSRRAETTILKPLEVVGQAKVYTNTDGTVSVDALKDLNGEPKKFKEVGPLLFRELSGQDRIAFKRDDSGRLVLVIDFPFMVFQKSFWYQNSTFNLTLIIGSLAVLVLVLLLWPIAALIRWHYGRKLELTPQQRRLWLLVRIVCLVDVVFFGAFVGFLAAGLKDIDVLSPSYNPLIRLIQIVGWIGVLGTVIALYNAIRSWKEPQRWLWSRLGDSLIALACLGVVWFVFNWNMLHWSLKY